MAGRKGTSLPLDTVIMLILAAIVLAALLSFFLGTFTPAQSKVDILKKQTSLCQQIFTVDSGCDVAKINAAGKGSLVTELQSSVCGKPTDAPVCTPKSGISDQPTACIKGCCAIFCP